MFEAAILLALAVSAAGFLAGFMLGAWVTRAEARARRLRESLRGQEEYPGEF